MSIEVPLSLLRAMARECDSASISLQLLQQRLSSSTMAGGVSDDLIKHLQTLDLVQQTISDLAALMAAIGREDTTDAALAHRVTDAVKQASLKQRLLDGLPTERPLMELDPEDEIWT